MLGPGGPGTRQCCRTGGYIHVRLSILIAKGIAGAGLRERGKLNGLRQRLRAQLWERVRSYFHKLLEEHTLEQYTYHNI